STSRRHRPVTVLRTLSPRPGSASATQALRGRKSHGGSSTRPARHSQVRAAGRRVDDLMDARSFPLPDSPPAGGRLAGAPQFPPSERIAEALEPSSDPVVVARALD